MDGNGMRAVVPSPSGSHLPTFFRWCLGGMSTFASGSGSASARRDADAGASVLEIGKELGAADCCDFSASQADLLARAEFLVVVVGGGGGEEEEEEEEEEAEVFSTPPLTEQDPQRQGQSQRGQAGEGEDGIAMCSMPFTETQSSSTSSSSFSSPPSDSWELKPRKPRICTRKVRAGAKIRTPTPAPTPSPCPELDPLVRIVLMIPTAPLPTTGHEDILELARSRGIFSDALYHGLPNEDLIPQVE